jgi:hypothetical protein
MVDLELQEGDVLLTSDFLSLDMVSPNSVRVSCYSTSSSVRKRGSLPWQTVDNLISAKVLGAVDLIRLRKWQQSMITINPVTSAVPGAILSSFR